ncbi:MAG: hypothetical protein WEB09_03840 [Nitriliruptor sp.]
MNAAFPPRLRVALSAAPPLLADSLRVLLADEHTDVTLIVDGGCDRYDVAIVTADVAADTELVADIVIELDSSPQTRGGGVIRDGAQVTVLPDLAAVISTVHGLQPNAGAVG